MDVSGFGRLDPRERLPGGTYAFWSGRPVVSRDIIGGRRGEEAGFETAGFSNRGDRGDDVGFATGLFGEFLLGGVC